MVQRNLICAIVCLITFFETINLEKSNKNFDTSESEEKIGLAVGDTTDSSEEYNSEKAGKYLTVDITRTMQETPEPKVLPKGCFFNFMVNICEVILNRFGHGKISAYFEHLSEGLRGLGYGYLQKLVIRLIRRRIKKYSGYKLSLQKIKVQNFLAAISSGKPKVNEYFTAMNNIFPIRLVLKLEDYVFRVRNYAKGLTRHIRQRTQDVLKRVIFRTVDNLDDKLKWELENKFKDAIVEYADSYNSTF